MMTVRLPHPWLVALVNRVKLQVTGIHHVRISEVDLVYSSYRGDADTADLIGIYDESGNIYIEEGLTMRDARFADLVAYHEFLEISAKRAGSSHARAHRRAVVGSLIAAKEHLPDLDQMHAFLDWQIGAYPREKVGDPGTVIAEIENELLRDCLGKGRLLDIVTRHRL